MSISEQLIAIADLMQNLLDNINGAAIICPDLVHLWRKLFDGTQTAKALILFTGERVRGDFPIAAPLARVDRDFMVVISRGRSLGSNAGDALVESVGNAPPLYEIVETARDWIRGLTLDPNTTESPIDFQGVSLFNTEGSGRIVDAYQIAFSVGTQLLVTQPPGNDSPGQGSTT